MLGSDGSHLFKKLGIATMMVLLSDRAVFKEHGNSKDFHGEIHDNMVTVHSINHLQLGLIPSGGKILKGFSDGSIKPSLSVG